MIKTTLKISGMMCGMCETHINDAVRNAFKVKKVQSSHKKGETVILSETAPDEVKLRDTINKTGYTLLSCTQSNSGKRSFIDILFRR